MGNLKGRKLKENKRSVPTPGARARAESSGVARPSEIPSGVLSSRIVARICEIMSPLRSSRHQLRRIFRRYGARKRAKVEEDNFYTATRLLAVDQNERRSDSLCSNIDRREIILTTNRIAVKEIPVNECLF